AALGVALATALLRVLVAAAPEGTPRLDEVSVDRTALLFARLRGVVRVRVRPVSRISGREHRQPGDRHPWPLPRRGGAIAPAASRSDGFRSRSRARAAHRRSVDGADACRSRARGHRLPAGSPADAAHVVWRTTMDPRAPRRAAERVAPARPETAWRGRCRSRVGAADRRLRLELHF